MSPTKSRTDKSAGLSPASVIMSAAVALVTLIIIIPLPPWMIDILLGISISSSILMLMIVVNINRPLSFASFPSFLLLLTLFRVSLSVSTTRAILANGEAGKIVYTFGNLVAAGNLVVGLVLFSLVTIVQMLVITKGAERVAEVAARFTLDSMPGRQMSIDGDLRAGLATPEDVRIRRDEVQRESELYGSLDGAMKFVKGDAIATMIFVVVNIIGGITIGMVQRGLSFSGALQSYTILTIGDGLAAQFPSLLTSITAGFIVSRVRDDNRTGGLGDQMMRELRAEPRGLIATAFLLLSLGFVPGLPTPVFVILAALLGGSAYAAVLFGREKRPAKAGGRSPGEPATGRDGEGPASGPGEPIPLMLPRPILVRHNCDGVPRADIELTAFFDEARRRVYFDLGLPVPAIASIRDPLLPPGRGVVLVNEIEVEKFDLPAGQVLVAARRGQLKALGLGDAAVPAMKGDACWLPQELAPELESIGVSAMEPGRAFVEHVASSLKRAASDFLGIQQAKEIISQVERVAPDLVREATKVVPLPRIADVLQRLVTEDVSIRDMGAICNGLIESGGREKDPLILAETIRLHLRRQVCARIARDKPVVPAFVCANEVETLIRDSIRQTPTGSFINMSRADASAIIAEFRRNIGDVAERAVAPIVIVAPDIRRYVRKIIEAEYPGVPVLSYSELTPDMNLQTIGEIRRGQTAASAA